MKRQSLLFAAVVTVAGCAANRDMVWYRADATAEQARRDLTACQYDAELALAAYNTPGTNYARSAGDAIAKGLMAGLDVAARKDRVISSCMPAKGYALRARVIAPEQGAERTVAIATPPASRETGNPYMVSIKSTPVITSIADANSTASPGGQWAYAAEKAARAASCTPIAMARATAKGPGFETYAVPCAGGEIATLKCESGGCRVLK